jgi:hypothetical protein
MTPRASTGPWARPVLAVDRWLLQPAPATRLAALRLLVGGYALVFLVVRMPALVHMTRTPTRAFAPVGPLAWMPGPLSPGVAQVLLAVSVLAGVAFVAGWRWRLTGPAFALAFLAVTTYRMSWGHVIHAENLVALHLLVIGFTPAALAWSLDARRAGRPAPPADSRFGWPVQVMALLTVVAYVLAGIAKFRYGGFEWAVGGSLRNQVAYDNLRKILLGDVHSPVGGWLSAHGWVFPPIALFTVVVELGAPVALAGGRWRTAWVIAAWTLHLGILALMAILFPYQLSGIAYLPLFRSERLVERAAAVLGRSTASQSS